MKKLLLLLVILFIMLVQLGCKDQSTSQTEKNQSTNESVTYINQFTGYSIELPKSWELKYSVEEDERATEFLYNSDTDMRSPIFTIYTYSTEDWDQEKGKSNTLIELEQKDGKVFLYQISQENPYTNEEAVEFKQMVDQVKEIVKSFTLE